MVPHLTSKVDRLRPAYGFDDISLAPGTDTADPSDVDLSQSFCGIPLAVPIIASAMDAVVSPETAGLLHRLGSLACINLEGLWFRYDDPRPHFAAIRSAAAVTTRRSRAAEAEASSASVGGVLESDMGRKGMQTGGTLNV